MGDKRTRTRRIVPRTTDLGSPLSPSFSSRSTWRATCTCAASGFASHVKKHLSTKPKLAPFYPTQAWLLVYVDNTPKVANKLCADRSSTIDCSSSLMIRPTVNRRITAESSIKASLFSVHFFFISFLGRHRPAISDMHTRSIKMLGSLGRNAIVTTTPIDDESWALDRPTDHHHRSTNNSVRSPNGYCMAVRACISEDR